MSQQNRDVYATCRTLAQELIDEGRLVEAEAVLQALQTYIDVQPVDDGSSRNELAVWLDELSTRARRKRSMETTKR